MAESSNVPQQKTKGQGFFEEDTTHGLVKRFMLKRYLQSYIPITQRSKLTTVILDGFAGKGRYGNDWPQDIEKYGSPLIAVRVAVQFCINEYNIKRRKARQEEIEKEEERFQPSREKRKGTRAFVDGIIIPRERQNVHLSLEDVDSSIILIFVEKDQKLFKSLIQNILNTFHFYKIPVFKENKSIDGQCSIRPRDQGLFPIICMIINCEFNEVEEPREFWNRRYLTIIDPFGYSDTPMRSVSRFIGPDREVYITFMSSYVNRFVSKNPQAVADLYGLNLPLEEDDKEAVADFVANFVRKDQGNEVRDDLDKCVDNYENALKSAADSEFALTFEMRGESNARLYHLIFLTNRIKGLYEMKETMIRGTQEQGRFSLSEYKILRKGFQLSLHNDQENRVVAEAIFSRFRGKARICIDKVKYFILLQTPYVFRKRALAILEKEDNPRLIRVVGKSQSQRRRRCTYPDHTEWLLSFRN